MGEIIAMHFKMIVDEPQTGHQKYRTEGWLNQGLEDHFLECGECRSTIVKDLRDFATQIEEMGFINGG